MQCNQKSYSSGNRRQFSIAKSSNKNDLFDKHLLSNKIKIILFIRKSFAVNLANKWNRSSVKAMKFAIDTLVRIAFFVRRKWKVCVWNPWANQPNWNLFNSFGDLVKVRGWWARTRSLFCPLTKSIIITLSSNLNQKLFNASKYCYSQWSSLSFQLVVNI